MEEQKMELLITLITRRDGHPSFIVSKLQIISLFITPNNSLLFPVWASYILALHVSAINAITYYNFSWKFT